MLPFTEDAFTGPVIPLRERPPLTSLTFSRLAPRGTMMWYSTLAGCSASPPVYWVRMETSPNEVVHHDLGIVQAARIAGMLDGLHQHFVAIPRGNLHVAVEILNRHAPVVESARSSRETPRSESG